MTIEAILSTIYCKEIIEEPGYAGTKARFVIGAVHMNVETENGGLRINGLDSSVESLPKEVDRVILQK